MSITKLDCMELVDTRYSVYPYDGYNLEEILGKFYEAIKECNDLSFSLQEFNNWIISEGLVEEVEKQLSKVDWDNVVNSELYQKVLGELGKTNEQLETIDNYTSTSFEDMIRKPKRAYNGLYCINNIGDSISQGYNADYYYNTWAGIVRQTFNLEFNNKNHGYVPFFTSSSTPTFTDILTFNGGGGWTFNKHNKAMGFLSLKTSTENAIQYAYLTPQSKHKFKNIIVEVVKNASAGNIEIRINDKLVNTVNCNTATETTEFVNLDTSEFDFINKIEFKSISGTNEIINLYLLNDLDSFVFNNYAKSGAKMIDLTDDMIDRLFDCNCVLFSLGVNVSTDSEMDTILAKCKVAYDKYKPIMFVNDFCWNNGRNNVSEKLKKFAKDTNSKYIQIIDKVDNLQDLVTSGFSVDGLHPTNLGHEIIANKEMSCLKTCYNTKKSITMFNDVKNKSDEAIEILNNGLIKLKGSLDKTDANYSSFSHLKFAIEFKYDKGSPTLSEGLYLAKNTEGTYIYLSQYDTENYFISANLNLKAGEYVINSPSYSNIKYTAKISIGEDIDLASIPNGLHCKIVNGIVDDFTSKRTTIKDLILYS